MYLSYSATAKVKQRIIRGGWKSVCVVVVVAFLRSVGQKVSRKAAAALLIIVRGERTPIGIIRCRGEGTGCRDLGDNTLSYAVL